ncbi:uncharacterized protein KY384_004154 [Bacidia gigantensis]|uniref:uncharacterized protein n=1 Tax=Bacidia gigantensis TaxID=2732470 RepID=UPI001D03F74C|nr:uncharacterized protein KY384_004154 [Bacidia gigantensis]KAG8530797.1 hypothetical protein KY384_004154 [Bacidia gigantensis]
MHTSTAPGVAAVPNQYTLEKAQIIAAQFEISDVEIGICVQKFLQQMGAWSGLGQRSCMSAEFVQQTKACKGELRPCAKFQLTLLGSALGVDLGGSNLRVCLVELHGDTSYHVVQSKRSIPAELMVTHEAADLFAFITDQIEVLLRTHHPDCFSESANVEVLSLGLTFSFPVYQNAIDSGILLRWTKGFDIPSVVGQDVCRLLQQQIDLQKLPVKVAALVNDATGTIMSRAYTLPLDQIRTSVGTIFGTGTNGVYLEKLSKICKPLDGRFDSSTGEMLISIEWGSFDNGLSVLPNTEYDDEINRSSINPGNQMFEKRVSGMFLGELLRTVLIKLLDDPAVRLFQGSDLRSGSLDVRKIALHTRWAVDSSILSIAELDTTQGLTALRQKIVDALGVSSSQVSTEDAQIVKVIAHAIGKRAARLGGMALGAVVLKTSHLDPNFEQTQFSETRSGEVGSQDTQHSVHVSETIAANGSTSSLPSDKPYVIDVAVDGSVIEYYPNFEMYMRDALKTVPGIGAAGEKMIRINVTKDGSSVGAAITTLVVTQQT